MRVILPESESTRAELSEAIIEVIASWPALYRYVFSQVHYNGRSAKELAQALGLRLAEVERALRYCETDLFDALRTFRRIEPALPSSGSSRTESLMEAASR
jgi:DNA-directed RNA polymerase specialized sigma24 family protein